MARVKIDQTVLRRLDSTAAGEAMVTVYLRGTTTPATVYDQAGATIGNPFFTNEGRIEAYVNEGRYDIAIEGVGYPTYTQEFEAVAPLANATVPPLTFQSVTANGAVGSAGTITAYKDPLTGTVFLEGTINFNGSGVASTIFAQLPVGYRPGFTGEWTLPNTLTPSTQINVSLDTLGRFYFGFAIGTTSQTLAFYQVRFRAAN